MSAYFYAVPSAGIYVTGDVRPNSKFLGNRYVRWLGSVVWFLKLRDGEGSDVGVII